MEEILNFLSKKYGSDLTKIQTNRYVFANGSTNRIEAIRSVLEVFLSTKYDISEMEAKSKVLEFERSFNTKPSRESKNQNVGLVERFKSLIPVVSGFDSKVTFLVDRNTYERVPWDIEVFCDVSGLKWSEISKDRLVIKPIYNPRMLESHFTVVEDGVELTAINSYLKPSWMSLDIPNPKIPTLFQELIDSLVANESSKIYLYDWLYKSLTDKAYTYLVLCGAKGVGKGKFEQLVRALHGFDNFTKGKKDTITDKFNSQLKDTRLVWFDEFSYTKENANILKLILNDDISIEGKGVDATRSTNVHFSAVISNNEHADNYIELDDRRFSPLELGTVDIKTKFTQEWFDEYDYHTLNLGEKSTLVAEFGHWILKYGKCDKIGRQEPYKGEMFNQLVLSSLKKWQEFIINIFEDEKQLESILKDRDYFLYSDLQKKHSVKEREIGVFPRPLKVYNFIRDYRDVESGEELAIIRKEGKENRIYPKWKPINNYEKVEV